MLAKIVTIAVLFIVVGGVVTAEKSTSYTPKPSPFPTTTPVAIKPTPKPEGICGRERQDVLLLAIDEGLNYQQVKEVAEFYDVVCNGKSPEKPTQNISISEKPQIGFDKDFAAEQEQRRITDCQKKQANYSNCLSEYNAKLLEYQNCVMGSSFYCSKPFNSCTKPYCN
jgi:hypothetical protein